MISYQSLLLSTIVLNDIMMHLLPFLLERNFVCISHSSIMYNYAVSGKLQATLIRILMTISVPEEVISK